jgi:hypothetical protein
LDGEARAANKADTVRPSMSTDPRLVGGPLVEVGTLDRSTTLIVVGGASVPLLARRIEGEVFESVRRGRLQVVVDISSLDAPTSGLLRGLERTRRLLLALGGELTVLRERDRVQAGSISYLTET